MPKKILLSGKRYREPYLDAVSACGALPTILYLPQFADELDALLDFDALLLCGGDDVNPSRYGQEMNGTRAVDDARDAAEFYLLERYIAQGKPVFGVCRGHQVLNIYFGGTLIQDLPNGKDHSTGEDFSRVHELSVEDGSILAAIYGTNSMVVNSYHHQAVENPGKGLRITARSFDGVVEATEHESLPIFSVQYHPEQMCCAFARDEVADGLKLFQKFVSMIP